jgi:CRISPR-associated protein Csb2
MRKLEQNAASRRARVRTIIEVRVGDRFVRWVGAARARRLGQDRDLAARVIPARPGRPGVAAPQPGRDLAQGIFSDDLIVLVRVGGPRLPITSVAGLARQFRRALMAFADQPVAEVISGHRADGAAAEIPHLAVVPLPAVTGPRPDGTLLGIALVLPRDVDVDARGAVMRAIARFEDAHRTGPEAWPPIPVLLGDPGRLVLQRAGRVKDCGDALRSATWIGPARRWASATPIALDRNPGDLHHADPARRSLAFRAAAACVIEAVRRIGLPAPVEVDVLRSCALPGTAEPQRYPRFPPAPQRLQRVLVHARLRFGEPVRGPVLVGAGRFQGLGLFMPDDEPSG